MQKKLLLLGGSKYLMPVIRAAHDLGIYVITCDFLPDNLAHKYSDEFANISIVEKEPVLAFAKENKVNGIMSFATDPGVVTAAYVAEQLGLPSVGSYEAVSILQDKGRFRSFLKENGFRVPVAESYTGLAAGLSDADRFPFPVIVKPVDSAGSKGVRKVNTKEELKNAIAYALSYSRSQTYIIEEFLEAKGSPSDSDCFSIDGKMVFYSFDAQRFDAKSENIYTPSAYSWPSTISQEHQEELKSELQRLISLLHLGTSVYNIETRECINGLPYIMEVSPRGGGNRLSEMVRYIDGVDLISNAVKFAVGMKPDSIVPNPSSGNWAILMLHSDTPGTFKELWLDDSLKDKVVEKDLWIEPGTPVGGFKSANEAIGSMVIHFDNQEQMEQVMNHTEEYVKVLLD